MKKEWEKPTATVVVLPVIDIICASGGGCGSDGEDIGEWD